MEDNDNNDNDIKTDFILYNNNENNNKFAIVINNNENKNSKYINNFNFF